MGRVASEKTIKNRKRRSLIEASLSEGLSGNDIQKLLQSRKLGVQRKKLYEEIRSIQGTQLRKEKSEKSIPKKYRKKRGGGLVKTTFGKIYRGSLILSSIPLHSTPFNRKYLGFRMNIFSFDKDEVKKALNSMKKQFLRMIGDDLKSYRYGAESWETLGTEGVVLITVSNPDNLNGKWFYAKEEHGRDTGSKSGYI